MKKFFILRLVVFELFVVLLLSLSISGLVYFGILKTEFLFVANLIAHIINIAIVSFIVTRHYKEKGLLIGIVTSLIYNGLSVIVNLLIDEPLDKSFWLKVVILMLVSTACGTITINLIKTDK